jgi:type I restriction enzyme S subunit
MIFYKETDFKETPVGKIPKDWELKRLGDVCAKITDGTHKTPKYVDKGIPFLSTQNIVPFRKGFDFSEYEKYITREEHEELIKRCKPEKGDILVSKCGTIGRAKLIDVNYEFSIFVGLALLKLKKDLVIGEFLEQMLNYDPCRLRMEVSSPGSTRKTLTIHAIERLQIPFPSLEEQRAIVGVLGVVDSVIAKTGEVIAKTERLKKGLMQTLLTRGIGHKEYKQTPIGKIPEDWETVKLEELLNLRNGQRPKISETGHFPIFGANGIMGYTDEFLTENDFTLIFGRVGASGEMHLGEGKIWVSDNAIFSQSYNKNRVYPPYLFYLLKFKNLSQFALKTTHPIITKTFLDNFSIQLPRRLEEQKKIASILTAMDEKLQLEHIEKTRLERIKRGLMDLLLTGKIRVKVD